MIGVVTRTDLRAAHTRRTRAAIRAAALALTRERGYAAMTIDDVAAATRLLDMGVDGIVTDVPELMRDALRDLGYELAS